jgi:hypothetical protein
MNKWEREHIYLCMSKIWFIFFHGYTYVPVLYKRVLKYMGTVAWGIFWILCNFSYSSIVGEGSTGKGGLKEVECEGEGDLVKNMARKELVFMYLLTLGQR